MNKKEDAACCARDDRLKHLVQRHSGDKDQRDPLRTGLHSRGYLPHLKLEGAVYFVTFRTDDSLPKEVYRRLLEQRKALDRKSESLPQGRARREAADEAGRLHQREIERALDSCHGACHFRRIECAEIMKGALNFFDRDRYLLKAWVVMPNHVHSLVWPKPPHRLGDILKSWKTFTAREINKVIGQTGKRFWQPESFDRWVRDFNEEIAYKKYIENNPVKAGLCGTPEEWPWSSASQGT